MILPYSAKFTRFFLCIHLAHAVSKKADVIYCVCDSAGKNWLCMHANTTIRTHF